MTRGVRDDGPSDGRARGRGGEPAPEARRAAGIEYLLRRSRRARRLRVTVHPDASVVVTLPHRAPVAMAESFVTERSAWIERHLARLAAERARLADRPALEDGRMLPFAGQPHRIEVRPFPSGRRSRVEHDDAIEPVVRVWRAAADGRTLAQVLERWLRSEAREAIERRIRARAPQLGVEPVVVSIRDQRSRWGSASRAGRLSFSWRLVQAPPAVLDYVVVHELAHLRVFGHPPRFWRLVRSIVPEADAARRWLRTHARDLRATLDDSQATTEVA